MTNWKKLLELAKDRNIDGKKVKNYMFFCYENWEDDEMTPEQLELRNMLREGKIPNPFPIFENEEV